MKKDRLVNTLTGAGVIGWFLLSFAGIIYSAETENIGLLALLAGQYFLVFGVFAMISNIKSRQFPLILVMFPLVGVGGCGAGVYMMICGEQAIADVAKIVPYALLAVFPVAGVLLMISGIRKHLRLRRVCTYAVKAQCVEVRQAYMNLDGRIRRNHKVYMPVYDIYYNGKHRKVYNNEYSNTKIPEVGEYCDILINPDNPSEFTDGRGTKDGMMQAFVGAVFVAMFLLVLYMMAVLQ